jgi:ribosomal protein S13
MKFEHVLQIYWTKGFFFGGNLFYTNQTLTSFLSCTPGLSKQVKKTLNERFELTNFLKQPNTLIPSYELTTARLLVRPLNIFLSQINSVNNNYKELTRLNIIRYFLIKSHRGYGHAVGKPVHGQRTWSNAWNSYRVNKTLRFFLAEMKNKNSLTQPLKKHNYKVLQKKYPKSVKKKKKVTIEVTKWF